MIRNRHNTTFSVERDAWTRVEEGGVMIDKTAKVVVLEFKGYRQQSTQEYIQSLGLQMTRPHLIWCDVDTAVGEGDTLVSEFGYDKVGAVQTNRDGVNPHKELAVEFLGEIAES